MKVLENYSLLPHNTFGMDVRARYFVEYDSVDELTAFLRSDLARQNRLLHIGAGSNLLFVSDFDGVVLHSNICFCEVQPQGDGVSLVRVGAGVVWDDLCADMVQKSLGGIENLSYIPGEVGASAVQNIGAYGVEVGDVISQVETVEIASGWSRTFDVEECAYGYRQSIFKGELAGKFIVTAVVYRLQQGAPLRLDYGNLRAVLADMEQPTIADVRRAVIAVRKSKLPEPCELGSAGSFFKNPVVTTEKFAALIAHFPTMPHYEARDGVKIPAAWLIEQCGWKGKTHGGAAVYDKQPLVLVNYNRATPNDIVELAQRIVDSVKAKFGIDISPEVNYV